MRLLKQALALLGAFVVFAGIVALVAPTRVHAVAAALVQVTNTSANPVPTIDSTAAFPFATTLVTDTVSLSGAFTVPSTTSTGVPVKRLVIETMSVECDIGSGTQNFLIDLQTPNPDPTAGGFQAFQNYFFPVVASSAGTAYTSAPSAVRIYMNPGAQAIFAISGTFPANGGAFCSLALSGHLETQ